MTKVIGKHLVQSAFFVSMSFVALSAASVADNAAPAFDNQLVADQDYFKNKLKDKPSGVYVEGGRLYAMARLGGLPPRMPDTQRRMKAMLAANAVLRDWALSKTVALRQQKTEMPTGYQKARALLERFSPRWCVGEWKINLASREFVEKKRDEYVLFWAMEEKAVEKSIPELFKQPLTRERIIPGIKSNVPVWLSRPPEQFFEAALGEEILNASIDCNALAKLAQGDVETILAGVLSSGNAGGEILTAYGRLLSARGLKKDAVQCYVAALKVNLKFVLAWIALSEDCIELKRNEMAYGAAVIARGLAVTPEMRDRADALMLK